MGKYMKKAKTSPDVEASSIVGVRTRAKTLALRRLHHPQSCYLQLRSRRLEKLVPIYKPRANPNPRNPNKNEEGKDVEEEIEGSFGENALDSEGRSNERDIRESTPCSFIRDSTSIGTPGSSTRTNYSTTAVRRVQSSVHRNVPTSYEMEEFFSGPEKVQQKAFIENYNFDPVNDCPLPGRYEWVKLEKQ